MTPGIWVTSAVIVVVVLAAVVVLFSRKKQAKLRVAETYNLARRALDEIDFNRRELAHPTETTALALKLKTIEILLTSPEFVEIASTETFLALRAYRDFAHALGRSAMVQRTDTGEPLVMSRLLSEEGGREKYERLSQEAEDALRRVFENRNDD